MEGLISSNCQGEEMVSASSPFSPAENVLDLADQKPDQMVSACSPSMVREGTATPNSYSSASPVADQKSKTQEQNQTGLTNLPDDLHRHQNFKSHTDLYDGNRG